MCRPEPGRWPGRTRLSTHGSEVSSGQTHHGTWDTRLAAGTQHPGESISGVKGQAEGRGHGLDPPEAYAEGAQAWGGRAEPERETPFRGAGPQKNGEALGGDRTLTAPRILPSPDPGSKPTPQPPQQGPDHLHPISACERLSVLPADPGVGLDAGKSSEVFLSPIRRGRERAGAFARLAWGGGRACSAGAEWGGVGWGASTKPKYLNITDLRHCLWPAGHGWLCKPHVCQKAAHRAENRNPGRSRLHSPSVGAQRSLHSTYFFLDQRFSPRGDFASRRPLCLETFLAVTSQGCSGYLVGERPGCR